VSRWSLLALVSLAACATSAAPPPTRTVSAWEQRFVTHDGVRIEYRVRPGAGVPIVFVPGMANPARDYEDNAPLVEALGTRTILAISIRGRGASDAPETGWTVAAQASDITAVVEHEHLARYHLAAHSMGVGYALFHALANPSALASFTAADYRPGLPLVSEDWAARGADKPRSDRYDPRIKRRMLREQGTEDWTPALSALAVPALAILSTESSDRFVEDLWKAAPDVRVLWIEHGHDTFTNRKARAALVDHLDRADRAR
jgi:pimeloyl-ACP methyl ester carboxylesterase